MQEKLSLAKANSSAQGWRNLQSGDGKRDGLTGRVVKECRFAMPWALIAAFWLLLGAPAFASASKDGCERPFAVSDYFQTQSVVELAISDSGDWVAYVTEVRSLELNRNIRQVYLLALAPGGRPVLVNDAADAHDIAWIPHSRDFAYLSGKSGTSQIYSSNVYDGTVRQRTYSSEPVTKFRFSPDGKRVAYATIASLAGGSSLFKQVREGQSGILVDTDMTSLTDLVNPSWGRTLAAALGARKLWVEGGAQSASLVGIPGSALDFFWASDSRSLSVTYVSEGIPATQLSRMRLSSVGIVDATSGRFRVLFEGRAPHNGEPGIGYVGGQWIPQRRLIFVARIIESDLWVSRQFPKWTISSAFGALRDRDLRWRAAETLDEQVQPVSAKTLWVENTVKGVRSLFEWTASETDLAPAVRGIGGSHSHFSFSGDLHSAVFINQSLSRAPEVYLWRQKGGSAIRITDLNAATAAACAPKVSAITWKSADGQQASGWLFAPRSDIKRPLPLLTFVHGGPGPPVGDEFCPTFSGWPFPLEVYPAYGIAVFIPNYRGTMTFGREFSSPHKVDEEPVNDITSGIRYLTALGVADPDRLGIAGYSHGGWLGPMVLTREPRLFRAASFAEGTANMVVLYESMGAAGNREVYDGQLGMGRSLYDAPERYLAISPDLHFNGLSSANMFEAGAESLALHALAFGKASNRFGLPTETIVYPRSGHALTIPLLQKESAERNLDWFRFWLKGDVDESPAKAHQYERWRAFRSLQTAARITAGAARVLNDEELPLP